jgi:hypothetical protein
VRPGSGGAVGIEQCDRKDGADMRGPHVSGGGERWQFGQKGATQKRRCKPENAP